MTYGIPNNYEFFYQGTYSQLDPNYGKAFLGYRVPFSNIQLHTNPQTPNIVSETVDRLRTGVKGVMVNVLDAHAFEHIPKQLFEEVRRLHKLAGAEPSMHAPVIDPAGFGERGVWNEGTRQENEARLKSILDKAHLADPSGNMPVTVHASMMNAAEWWKNAPEKEGEGKRMMLAIDTDTHQPLQLEYEEKFYPGPEKEEDVHGKRYKFIVPGVVRGTMTPEDALDAQNSTHWHHKVAEIDNEKIHADRVLEEAFSTAAPVFQQMQEIANKGGSAEDINQIPRSSEQQQAINKLQSVAPIYDDVGLKLNGMFNDAYKYYSEQLEREKDSDKRRGYVEAVKEIQKIGQKINDASSTRDLTGYAKMHDVFGEATHLLNSLSRTVVGAPKTYVPIEEFALPHSAETIASAALHSYKKYGDKAPVIAIENVLPNMLFSRADSLKKLIEETREKFVEKATKEGYSRGNAEYAADKLIGATWDVGHIHLLKKSGYKNEDIIKETEKITPFTKFVHLTDNFGFEDSHLAPGMGEVPFKEMLKELEKAGKLKTVIEAGGLMNLGKEAGRIILPSTLEALGSPISSNPYTSGPFWNQAAAIQGSYNMGYGQIFPDQHFQMYGGGFSGLPQDLGGQVAGRGQRFSGSPME